MTKMEINISGSRLSPTTVDRIDDIDVFCVTNEEVHITHLQPNWNKKSYLQLRHQTELSLFSYNNFKLRAIVSV